MRNRIATAALAASLLGVAACGGDDGGTDGPVSLRMTIWSANEAHLALFDEIADAYLADNPGVAAISFDPLPFENYTTTLTTQIAGGNPPDLAWIFESSAPDFVTSGVLAPLDEVVTDADDLVDSATALWRDGDTLYAYPFSTSPFGVFVNRDLIAEASRPDPAAQLAAGEWTWANAVDTAAAVNAATDRAGLVIRDFDYQGWDYLSTVWAGWGAQAWSDDGRECGFTDPAMVDAMTFLHEAIFTAGALPGPGTTADFFAGEAALTITQISRASLLEDGAFDWDLLPLPAGPAGEYAVIGQGGVAVLQRGPNAEAAADFLGYLTNPENSAKLARFFPPPRQSLLTADTLAQTNPLLTPEQLQQVVIDGIAAGVVKPSHTDSAEINQAVRAALDPMWRADADVPGVLAGVCAAIAPLLAG
ncbi:sugar ABC transporter substrate-binding protein [Solwaraspora sp. WMMD791]|uniref:ABC transporter substrate-binding protein n=1 Tax=Solwaraspora sp. WMMD791 TaxID=3016086 RepID=UPI00249AB8F9|nr:sugar ABC transporter substrate-binding protein [Solwaraspora sp. WMMD791]WFE28394.1 sugar ABC transporter substrate-binding protein [Solwaraspora sp. WMMD791]